MRNRIISTLLLAVLFCALPGTTRLRAQSIPTGPGGSIALGTVAATGQLGSTISYYSLVNPPSNHTVDWNTLGTPATSCLFSFLGSSTGTTGSWHSLSGIQSCANFTVTGTTNGSQSVSGVSNTQYMLPGQALSGSCLAANTTVATVGANSFTLSTNAASSGPCTITVLAGTGMIHMPYKPAVYLQLLILAYTPGDGTTQIPFNYTRGS